MALRDVQATLAANGFPCGPIDGILGLQTKAAVTRFQQAHNGPTWLAIDGIPGPLTQAALELLPHLSAHFEVTELACHHCGCAYVHRELLAALEALRDALGAPVPLLDAYRCPIHNRDVGGAKDSMHMEGLAADPAISATVGQVYAVQRFSGIGDKGGIVRHVDVRHLSAANLTPDATPASPARWHY